MAILRQSLMISRTSDIISAASWCSTMLFQPFTRILKDKVVLATDSFITQGANLLRWCKEIEVCVNRYSFHLLSNSASWSWRHGNRWIAMFNFRNGQTCYRRPICYVLHREMPALACQHNSFTHELQLLCQGSWHHLSECILSHNCILSGAKIHKNV